MAIESERGVSDEGDPWFVFCHPDGHVVVHIARIGGLYHLHCPALEGPLSGPSFDALLKAFVGTIPAPRATGSGRVVAHPSALLSLIVAAALFSVDTFVHRSAHAAELPVLPHGPLLAGLIPSGAGAKASMLKTTFAKALADAIWRGAEGREGETMIPSWGVIETVAIALAVLPATEFVAGNSLAGFSADPPPPPAVPAALASGESTELSFSGSAQRDGGTSASVSRPDGEAGSFVSPAGSPAVTNASPGPAATAGPTFDNAHIATGSASAAGTAEVVLAGGAALTPNLAAVHELDIKLAAGGGSIDLATAVDPLEIVVSGRGSLILTHATAAQSIEIAQGAQVALTVAYDPAPPEPASKPADASLASTEPTLTLDGGAQLTLTVESSAASTPSAGGSSAAAASTSSMDQTLDTETHHTVAPPSAGPASVAATQPAAIPVSASDPIGASIPTTSDDTPVPATPVAPKIILDSEGASPNTFFPSGPLNLEVIGPTDLSLDESSQTFDGSNLDASGLTGKLVVAINLTSPESDLNIGSGNLVVAPQTSFALEHLGNGSEITLGINLQTVIFGYDSDVVAGTTPISLWLNIGAATGTPSPVTVAAIDANNVNELAIASSGAPNTVQMIDDAALTNLMLTGAQSLLIDGFDGVTNSDDQSVVIDAQPLAGSLNLDASGIVDTLAGGRQVSIFTGSGPSTLTDLQTTEVLNFSLGHGAAVINIGAGATLVTIAGLVSGDMVNVGDAAHADTFVNGLTKLSPQQTAIDAATDLLAAASVAATQLGQTAPDQALLFAYKGADYVFIDVRGTHVFDPSVDGIVKIVGALPATDLAGVFHSA
jgi:hypothetical protein